MANDDYFKILYIILTELYEAKKQGKKINLDDISPQRFKITMKKVYEALKELKDWTSIF